MVFTWHLKKNRFIFYNFSSFIVYVNILSENHAFKDEWSEKYIIIVTVVPTFVSVFKIKLKPFSTVLTTYGCG